MLHRHQMKTLSLAIFIALALIAIWSSHANSQERRSKIRISNAGFTITALPLLAAKDWGTFAASGLDVELIVIAATLAPAALSQGDFHSLAAPRPPPVSSRATPPAAVR